LYVLFFPQLVAGPIERPQNLLHQFCENHTFDYERVSQGLMLMAWGFFQKMVIADQLAPIVDIASTGNGGAGQIIILTGSSSAFTSNGDNSAITGNVKGDLYPGLMNLINGPNNGNQLLVTRAFIFVRLSSPS
jgi:hypothetical protein